MVEVDDVRLLEALQFVLRTLRGSYFACANGERHCIERVLQIVGTRGHADDQADEVEASIKTEVEDVREHLHEDVDGRVDRFTQGFAPRGNHQALQALVNEQGLFVELL